MPLKYKSRTRIPRTAAVDWDSIIDELNASGKSSCLCNSESREHAIVYCNDAFCTLTGYLKSEIVQQNATGQFLAGPLTDEATLQEIEHALSHKKAIKVDVLLYQADGTPYWSLVKTETVVKRDRSRDETFMIVTHEDITASKLKRSHSNQFLGKHTLLWDATASDDDRRPSIQAPNGVISRPNAELIEAIIDKEHHHTTKDKLAQIISLNPDLLPEYRETKLPQSHFIILHYGLFRELWNWFIILLCIYTAIAVPYNIAFGNTGLITFNLVVDFMFIIDVILNFRTTYVSSAGRLVVDPKHISRRYLRGWFAVDCISALPLELAYFFISSSSSSLVRHKYRKSVSLFPLGHAGPRTKTPETLLHAPPNAQIGIRHALRVWPLHTDSPPPGFPSFFPLAGLLLGDARPLTRLPGLAVRPCQSHGGTLLRRQRNGNERRSKQLKHLRHGALLQHSEHDDSRLRQFCCQHDRRENLRHIFHDFRCAYVRDDIRQHDGDV
eukprot:m.225560 g.225560  ORF g.225560 m.225560 type:complete len:497 (+) comp40016_c0_seq13:300-1790(+)